ncbi:MAG: hypothetical protein U0414_23370 [Polyangiaceae bacterium]
MREVIGGGSAACAILWGGKLFCQGGNDTGQLGDGTAFLGTEMCLQTDLSTRACRPVPAAVAAPAPATTGDLENVRHASSAYLASCAVTSDGNVYCWGINDHLQLGHAKSIDVACGPTNVCNSRPTQVKLPVPLLAQDVAMGLRSACALTTDGAVYCWGDNEFGQLGVPLTTVSSETPVKVTGLPSSATAPVTQLRVDKDDYPMGCALAGGQVYCWGANYGGALGHDPAMDPACGSTACSFGAQAVRTSQGFLTGIVEIGVGRNWGCALDGNGAVWCWGADSYGTNGIGTSSSARFTADKVGGNLPTISHIAIDGWHDAFAIDAAGNVFGWGRNSYGSLALGKVGNGPGCGGGCEWLPVPTLLKSVAQLSSGGNVGLALLTDGSVVGWGENALAQLGHLPGTDGDVSTPGFWTNPTPAPVKCPVKK